MSDRKILGLGFKPVIKRDDYTGKVIAVALECRGMAMLVADGTYEFMSIMPPCESLDEFERHIDGLLDQLNAARKEARLAFQDKI